MSFEEQARQSVDTLVARLGGELERGLRALVEALLEDAARERVRAAEAAAQEARDEAAHHIDEAVRAAREESGRLLEEAVRAAREEAARQIEDAVRSAREEAAQFRDEAVEQSRRELDEQYRRALEEVERAAHDEIARVRAEAAQLADALAGAAAQEVPQTDRTATPSPATRMDERAAALAAELPGTRLQATEAVEALAAVEGTTRAAKREAALAGLGRLVDAVSRLDGCRSLRETLDALADAVAAAAARSMLLVVRGDRLRGWRICGFGAAPEPSALELPAAEAGELGEAVRTGQALQVRADVFDSRVHPSLGFARLTAHKMGLVVPVALGRDTVAVIYADDGGAADREVPAGWPEVVQILARHASRCLEALTALKSAPRLAAAHAQGRRPPAEAARPSGSPAPGVGSLAVTHEVAVGSQDEGGVRDGRREAGDPAGAAARSRGAGGAGAFDVDSVEAARRHAHLLVSEIKLFHEPAVRAGREHGDLRSRLRHEIDRARRLFYDHVPETMAGRDLIFERELVETLAGGRPELLGAPAAEPA